MIERLVFGCGHLTGGAGQTTSRRLVAQCLDAGLRCFDTAPLYGLGTTEAALGMALRRDGREARINAKVGLPRPRCGVLKSYFRAAKRVVMPPSARLGVAPPRAGAVDFPRGYFDPKEMARSFARTLQLLRVPSVETLFLHEAYADNLSPEAVVFLHEMQTRGLARYLGFANGAVFDPAIAALVPPDFLLQSAAPPYLFDGEERELSEALIFHTVINSFFWRRAVDAPLACAVEAACCRFKSLLGDNPDATVALGYILLGAAAPRARLIYTTKFPARLDAFLTAMGAVARVQAAAEIVAFTGFMYKERAQAAPSNLELKKAGKTCSPSSPI